MNASAVEFKLFISISQISFFPAILKTKNPGTPIQKLLCLTMNFILSLSLKEAWAKTISFHWTENSNWQNEILYFIHRSCSKFLCICQLLHRFNLQRFLQFPSYGYNTLQIIIMSDKNNLKVKYGFLEKKNSKYILQNSDGFLFLKTILV